VEHGADVNARLKNGKGGRVYTTRSGDAFPDGCRTDDVAFMRLLVELGAKPSLGNADNCTPLSLRAESESAEQRPMKLPERA